MLEKSGYLIREPDPVDRRNYRLFLTERGKQYKEICIQLAMQSNQETVAPLSAEEQKQLINLLKRVQ